MAEIPLTYHKLQGMKYKYDILTNSGRKQAPTCDATSTKQWHPCESLAGNIDEVTQERTGPSSTGRHTKTGVVDAQDDVCDNVTRQVH